ncbi:hypothetical protein PIB30_006105 [Stylosanthes scabra]|uniref:Uncharacterized protein n=1 Tax=Stylosanthes scabra TaxID=79078 RepID=A0ABU6W7M1_9FABA|nr:hypothetical protein [Stylosanthes scabra]
MLRSFVHCDEEGTQFENTLNPILRVLGCMLGCAEDFLGCNGHIQSPHTDTQMHCYCDRMSGPEPTSEGETIDRGKANGITSGAEDDIVRVGMVEVEDMAQTMADRVQSPPPRPRL